METSVNIVSKGDALFNTGYFSVKFDHDYKNAVSNRHIMVERLII